MFGYLHPLDKRLTVAEVGVAPFKMLAVLHGCLWSEVLPSALLPSA